MMLDARSTTESNEPRDNEEEGQEEGGGKRRGRKSNKLSETERMQIIYDTAKVMAGGEVFGYPPFPVTYRKLLDHRKNEQLVEIKDNKIVTPITDKSPMPHIINYIQNELAHIEPRLNNASSRLIDEIYKIFRITVPELTEEIRGIAVASYEGYAYKKLPYDLNHHGPFPTFEKLFAKFETNVDAIQAWIGSLFDPDADRSQYVWVYGSGQNGKSRLIHFFAETFGPAFMMTKPPSRGDAKRFWNAGVYNKRLVCMPDVTDFETIKSEEVKSITGDDFVPVEFKGADAFIAKTCAKLFFASNHEPNIQDFESDLRRIIYSRIKPLSPSEVIPKNEFDALLKSEGHAFLSHCWRLYQRLCPKQEAIPIDRAAAEALAAGSVADFQEIIDECFIVDPDLFFQKKHFNKIVRDKFGFDSKRAMAFLNWLKKKFDVRHVQPYAKGCKSGDSKIAMGFWGIGLTAEVASEVGFNTSLLKQPHWSQRDELEYARFLVDRGLKKHPAKASKQGLGLREEEKVRRTPRDEGHDGEV